MKNIFIINTASRGVYYGIGTYTTQLIEALQVDIYRLTVINLYVEDIDSIKIESKENIRYINIPKPVQHTYVRLSKEDDKYLRNVYYALLSYLPLEEEIIFHFNFMEGAFLAKMFKQNIKCKIVLAVHYMNWSFDLVGDKEYFLRILNVAQNEKEKEVKRIFDIEKDFLINYTDHIIAIANHSYDTLRTIYQVPSHKIVLIPNGLKDEYHKKSAQQKRNIKKRYYLDQNEKIILFVGRINPVKGVDYLIEAFSLLLKKETNVRLIIVGEGGENDLKYCLSKSVPVFPKISFTGFILKEEIYQLYQIAHIGIIPSLHEEFGYVALEMLMFKLPLIVNKTTGLKELVQNDVNGLYVDLKRSQSSRYNSINRLKSQIENLINDEDRKQRYKEKGREIFLAKYEIKVFKKNMQSFYNSI